MRWLRGGDNGRMSTPELAPAASARAVLNTRYSTTDTPAARRFEGWREAMGSLIDVQPWTPTEDFRGAVDAYAVPLPSGGSDHIVFSNCASSAVELHRGSARIGRDGLGHYAFQVFQAGGAGLQQWRGRESHIEPGGLVALDLRQPFRARRGDYHALALFVPRAAVEAHVPEPELLHGRTIARSAPLARLAQVSLSVLARHAATMSVAELQAALESALRLVLGALDTEAHDSPELRRGARSALLAKARAFLDDHLADPSLDPDLLAARLGISRSALYRLFAPHGGVLAYARAQRLRRALAVLQASDARSITRIAHDHGFGSASDFARAFRRHYGVSPSAMQGARQRREAARFPYAGVMRPVGR